MKLSIGFSPCPNDTFIFDALINKKIDVEGFEFEPHLEDVETLNQWAGENKLDITKISFPALFNNTDKYAILNAGSALGNGVGPLLISKDDVLPQNVGDKKIAIPGENTTANFLLSFAFNTAKNRVPILFSAIEDAVLEGRTDLGLIIHENRFTYAQKGLKKVLDLGEHWEEKTGLPIPLGCIAVSRLLQPSVQHKIDELIKKSLMFSFQHYPHISDYVKMHAQAMEEDVMRKHIDLYVNDFSIALGPDGKKAIKKLYEVYLSIKNKTNNNLSSEQLFVN